MRRISVRLIAVVLVTSLVLGGGVARAFAALAPLCAACPASPSKQRCCHDPNADVCRCTLQSAVPDHTRVHGLLPPLPASFDFVALPEPLAPIVEPLLDETIVPVWDEARGPPVGAWRPDLGRAPPLR